MSEASAPVWGCARHARIGKTCCQHTEILVTEGDRVRISTVVGRDDFWHDAWPADPSYADDGSDPAWTLAFHMDGSRPTLKRRPDGDCTFLGEQGCTLALETRPLVCRLFPLLFDQDGLGAVPSARCPPEVVPAGSTMAETLALDPLQGEQWRAQLYAEIGAAPGRGR